MTQMILAIFVFLSACSSSQMKDTNEKISPSNSANKILIVYLSRTNNTRAIAQMIQRNVGGKLVAIELEMPYPQNYRATVQQVVQENERGYLPPLKTKIDSIQQFDVIFIGFPTWGMKLPPPMKSFLKQYDLSGKTIVPFNTNDGYGIGTSFETVKELLPNSKLLEGFTTRGGVETDGQSRLLKEENAKEAEKNVVQWLQKIKLMKAANK